jgi:tectonic-1/3
VSCAAAVIAQVRLLTGVAYAESNLQSKLLYASACFDHGSWRFDRLNGPNLQLFELSFHVSFVPKAGQQPAMSVKPAPPLIAPLPPDLFYPFLTSGAGVQKVGLGMQKWLLMGMLLLISHVGVGMACL